MKPEEIKKIRISLGMTQGEVASMLGVSPLTVSQWETGYRQPSSLAVNAIKMIKSGCKIKEDRLETLIKKRFDWLNERYFGNELKRNYRIELSGRMKRLYGIAIPSKQVIRLAFSFLKSGDWEGLDRTLKHEMVHCWLYQRGRPWGHTKEFKSKLKEVILVGIM